jgi:hypothetical protein
METVTVMHEQRLNIRGGFQNVEYQIGEFSAMCTGILQKVVHCSNRDVTDHYDAMSIWWTTYWKWLSIVQLLESEGYLTRMMPTG